MGFSLLPGLSVVARSSSREIAKRMELFGASEVVSPRDLCGDHMRIPLRSAASYQLANPEPMQYRPRVSQTGGEWSGATAGRIVSASGEGTPGLWRVGLSAQDAPALRRWLVDGGVPLGDLLRAPHDRARRALAAALSHPSTAAYVVDGRVVPSSWIWRNLTRTAV